MRGLQGRAVPNNKDKRSAGAARERDDDAHALCAFSARSNGTGDEEALRCNITR